MTLPRWVAGMVAWAAVLPAYGQPEPGSLAQIELLEETLAAVADQTRASVVAIRADRRVEERESADEESGIPDDEIHRLLRDRFVPAVGSGIIISSDGLILTNEHVIHNAEPEHIEVLAGGQRYQVRGITSDPRSDLAVLRIDAEDLRAARLGDAGRVRQGHFAIVLGNPFGAASDNHGDPAMSFGVISALGQDLTQKLDPDRYYGNLIQTDARINPGNSGGPLLNIRGEVIGINTAISTRSGANEGVGYAIAIDERTRDMIGRLTRGEEMEYGYLGVRLDPPSPENLQQAGETLAGGALVTDVESGTPAAEAGLRRGDLVVSFDDEPVESVDALIRLVGTAEVGERAAVTVYRDRERVELAIVPARRAGIPRGVNTEVPVSWRGMKLSNPTPEVRERFKLGASARGAVVTYIETGGAADQAGLKPGQVIRQVNDVPIPSVRPLLKLTEELTGPIKIVLDADPALEVTLP